MKCHHCTRLTDYEIRDICQNGLVPLDAEHLERRIDRLVATNLIDETVRNGLLSRNWARESNRAGKLAFIVSPADLKSEQDVGWLLNFWGGEALTMHHAENHTTGPILWSIGVACIFEVEHMPGEGEESHRTESGCPKSAIVAVHRYGDREFERLTECSRWSERFSLNRPKATSIYEAWESRFGERGRRF